MFCVCLAWNGSPLLAVCVPGGDRHIPGILDGAGFSMQHYNKQWTVGRGDAVDSTSIAILHDVDRIASIKMLGELLGFTSMALGESFSQN